MYMKNTWEGAVENPKDLIRFLMQHVRVNHNNLL